MLPLDHIADSELQDQDQDPYAELTLHFKREKTRLIEEVGKYIQIPKGMKVLLNTATQGPVPNATGDKKTNTVTVYPPFFNDDRLNFNDRVSVLFHEIVHVKEDIVAEIKKYTLTEVVEDITSIPMNTFVKEKLRSLYEDDYETIDEMAGDYMSSFKTILNKEYYVNEVNAYEKEIATIKNVSYINMILPEISIYESTPKTPKTDFAGFKLVENQ